MTPGEYDTFRPRLVASYAADHARAGTWNHDEAEARATAQIDELLPDGPRTDGMLVLTAESPAGVVVGHLWVVLERRPGAGGGAWINSIEIMPEHRGKGYGRALLAIAERETARHGIGAIGLNVFGWNAVARRLYETAGYEVATLQMQKALPTR